MWKSLPCHSTCATAWWNESPDIVSCANSGFTPTISGCSSSLMNASMCPDGRQQDVAARLVGLRLEREAQGVPPLTHVLAREVHGLGVAVERGAGVHRRVDFASFTPAPHDEHLGAELHPEVDGVERLRQREASHLHVVRGERAVAEHRLREQVAGGHRHPQAGLVERALEPGDDRVPLGRARAGRHEVVVVEADAVRARPPARCFTESTGSSGARTSWPNGSRPGLPTVQRPKVKWSSGTGVNASLMTSPGVCSLITLRSGHGSAAEDRPAGDACEQPRRGPRRRSSFGPARAHRGRAAHVVGEADGVRNRRRPAHRGPRARGGGGYEHRGRRPSPDVPRSRRHP